MFLIPAVDFDAIVQEARAKHAAAAAKARTGGRFIGTSLGDWMSRVNDAGVPAVPADKIATFARSAFLELMDGGDDRTVAAMAPLREALAKLPPDAMARFDPCSGVELKHVIAEGLEPTRSDRQDLLAFDPRAFDIIHEFPADHVDVWSRPWIRAKKIDGYPVEFRVFVENSEIKGVASYYPQRPLPQTGEISGYVGDCLNLTYRVLDHLQRSKETPWMPSYEGRFVEGLVSATLDFIVTDDGNVLFLEAGPPYGAGAHPCAFIDQEIRGVALALAPGVSLR
ncbi:hypothetical protein ABIC83_002959 [Roseateles asaccharophilus]|uniref:hypothetical protein n=1 Tax=Roseateles asaccharophilus TaxID=582607 RepID=UPI003834E661